MIVIILVAVCAILLYHYTTRNHDYWEKRNVKHDKPLPFFGNHLQNFLVRRTNPDIGTELYNKYKGEKIVGYYRGTTPELIIRDPEIVRHILSADFKNFSSRGGIEDPKNDPLLNNMLFVSVDKWRVMRQQVTPGLSKSRLRNMFPLLLQCADELQKIIGTHASSGEEVDVYDIITKYTLQSIGFCCFGVELNTVTGRTYFTNQAKNFFIRTKLQVFVLTLAELLPEITKCFKHKIVGEELQALMIELTRKVRAERNFKPIGRNDFMDLLLELENQGKLLIEPSEKDDKDIEANLKYVAAQLFLFLLGGFETSATAMCATLHQLAYHPEIQQKIHEEIKRALSKNEHFTYDSLEDLTQLVMAFKESMRLTPPFGSVRRVCAEKYTIPGTDVTIDPGVRVMIPIQALHMDSEYFDNPKEFRPERFSPEAEKRRPNFTYIAFGEGPRKCIGARLAQVMVSAGLAAILKQFTVIPAPSSSYRLNIKKSSYLAQIVEGGFPLKFVPRK